MMSTETIAREESDVTAAANPFCWYELVTTDHDAAMAFYAKVTGWMIADSGMTDPVQINAAFSQWMSWGIFADFDLSTEGCD